MIREPLLFVATCDVSGRVRGKAFPLALLEKRAGRGVGWTPTNVQITCFDAIAESPYGSLGDLLLVPDRDSRVTVDFEDGSPAEDFMLGDILTLDGAPWECCTRSILKSALKKLEDVAGVRLVGAFEHEFHLKAGDGGGAYSMQGYRNRAAFAETLMAAIKAAGLKPDTVMKEYGVGQYEVTISPERGVRVADAGLVLREMVRATARRFDDEASFTPIRHPDGVGNGVHIHFSLEDKNGKPLSYDPKGSSGVSEIAGHFIAGILAHGRALCAVTAPSRISYDRLRPNAWSASVTNLGHRDREALVRICPVSEKPGAKVEKSFNFEYRAADAAATPHLALGAIVRAGLMGLRGKIPLPKAATVIEIAKMSEAEKKTAGIETLPSSLGDALDHLEKAAEALMPEGLKQPYLMHKRGEIQYTAEIAPEELFSMYAQVY